MSSAKSNPLKVLEASTGIEPVYTDLQSAASPLRQLARVMHSLGPRRGGVKRLWARLEDSSCRGLPLHLRPALRLGFDIEWRTQCRFPKTCPSYPAWRRVSRDCGGNKSVETGPGLF